MAAFLENCGYQTLQADNQVQLFDSNGKELLRVEKRDRLTAIIPLHELKSEAANDFLADQQWPGGGR